MLKQQNNKNDSLYLYIHIYMYAKECLNYHTTALISHTSKITLEILQVRFQKYVNQELPNIQAGSRKRRGIQHSFESLTTAIREEKGMKFRLEKKK